MKSLPYLLLLLHLMLCRSSSAMTPELRDQYLLQSVRAADMPPQGWTWQTIEKLLSQPQGSATEHVELQRSVDSSPAQPTRKAGCRHLYWKGPTAC